MAVKPTNQESGFYLIDQIISDGLNHRVTWQYQKISPCHTLNWGTAGVPFGYRSERNPVSRELPWHPTPLQFSYDSSLSFIPFTLFRTLREWLYDWWLADWLENMTPTRLTWNVWDRTSASHLTLCCHWPIDVHKCDRWSDSVSLLHFDLSKACFPLTAWTPPPKRIYPSAP